MKRREWIIGGGIGSGVLVVGLGVHQLCGYFSQSAEERNFKPNSPTEATMYANGKTKSEILAMRGIDDELNRKFKRKMEEVVKVVFVTKEQTAAKLKELKAAHQLIFKHGELLQEQYKLKIRLGQDADEMKAELEANIGRSEKLEKEIAGIEEDQ